MATEYAITQEIKYGIYETLEQKKRATWSEVVRSVAEKVDINPMYVERVMGSLVQQRIIKRHEERGFPTYSLLSDPPGRIEGKYADYNQKRLDIIKNGGEPSIRVDNTYGDETPWNADIKGPKAV